MNRNSKILYDGVLKQLHNKLVNNEFVTVRGQKTIEITNWTETFYADDKFNDGIINIKDIFKTSTGYIAHETTWYDSMNPNGAYIKPYAKIWEAVSDHNGMLNSNYGYLLFSPQNGYQYDNVLKTLKKDPYSRRAIAYYTNPFMHYTGGKDHICTMYVSYTIRNNKLQAFVSMRSSDIRYGLIGADLDWQISILNSLAEDLKVEPGNVHWHTVSAHLYERHFNKLYDIYRED